MPINEDTVKDTKCILPWISLETTPLGKVRPCCLSTEELSGIDLTQDTLDDAFDSKTMRDLRRSFRRGEKPSSCERCWLEEDSGKKSKREYMLEKFSEDTGVEVDYSSNNGTKLQFLDLKLGNICNLKCRICGSWSSSKWAQEQVAQHGKDHIGKDWLKQGQWPRKSNRFWENVDSMLSDIKYFEFTGGEPFLIKQHFDLLQRAVDQGYAGNVDIHYNTNGTQYPKQHEVWKHFKQVQIAFSIDNVGNRFEYERDGAKWATVNSNIKKFQKLKEQGYPLSFQICVTWNVQNIFYIDEFLTWAKTCGIDDIHFNLMHDPEEFALSKVPAKMLTPLVLKLQKAQTLHPKYADQIISLKNIVMQSRRTLKHLVEEKYRSGEALVKKLTETDNFRGIKFSDTHPEVAKMIGYE